MHSQLLPFDATNMSSSLSELKLQKVRIKLQKLEAFGKCITLSFTKDKVMVSWWLNILAHSVAFSSDNIQVPPTISQEVIVSERL